MEYRNIIFSNGFIPKGEHTWVCRSCKHEFKEDGWIPVWNTEEFRYIWEKAEFKTILRRSFNTPQTTVLCDSCFVMDSITNDYLKS